jgi:murein DD-endopeptidase MepM/ murein hydrolase activator NlpD
VKRARAESAAWTAGLVACATVALMGIATFMVHVRREWGGRPPTATAPAARMPAASGNSRRASPAVPTAVPKTPVPTPEAESFTRDVPVGDDGAPVASLPVAAGAVVERLRARALTLPVSGVTATALVPSFSQARGERVHEALDIMAPAGTPVVAVDDGTVAKLFTSKAGGLTIYQFDPAQSLVYYYAHLQGYASGVVDGAAVRRGQVIGYVGSTGNANPAAPHLHFAIFVLGPDKRWWQGSPIDPYPVFR